ncbi:hypothetical protein ACLOJK_018524 [Asimina triloba]
MTDTITGFLLAGVGNVDLRMKTNYLIVDSKGIRNLPLAMTLEHRVLGSQIMKGNEGCWRKEADEKLKRLHSLLFGANAALERSNFASAQILSLRLLGFLDSVSQKAPYHEQASIHHIRNEVLSKIDSAHRCLALETDR